jgi:GNAT superfamily N-acetyltransferase
VEWIFSTLDSSFDKTDFDCGRQPLNDYLKKYASQNMRSGYSVTFVVTAQGSSQIAGYYCASATTIEFANLPKSLSKKLPKYPAPAMLIGQLAVDKSMQGQGLGQILLMHALSRAVRISSELGIYAVRVDALDRQSKEFYLKYGFVPFKNAEFFLLLPIATILASRTDESLKT